MKKLLLLSALLIFALGFSQEQTIKVEIAKENPYSIYSGREGSQVDYSKISREINKSLNDVILSREEKKQQLKSLKEIVVNFVKDETTSVNSPALNIYLSEIKSALIYNINTQYSLLTKGAYTVESWKSFTQKVPDVITQLFMEIQSLDLAVNNSKKTNFKKNGDPSDIEIEKITSLILSQHPVKNNLFIFDKDGSPPIVKNGRFKKRGKLGTPYVAIYYEDKRKLFETISADVINAIKSSEVLTKDKITTIDFDSTVSKLKKLKELLDLELITKEEFDKKSNQLKKIILGN
jgi:hypothetical protein